MTDMNFPHQASAASALIGDPSAFGRVAEDGTVFVAPQAVRKRLVHIQERVQKKHLHTLFANLSC
jgi:hypothetical protein